jgi:hypothetical protein
MTRRLRRLVALGRDDRRVLLSAYLWLAKVDLALRLNRFRALAERAPRRPTRAVAEEDLRQAVRYARLIALAARHHAVPAHCLHRALVLHCWLLDAGLASQLRIGVRKEGADLKAHAWVELGGHVVNDRAAAVAVFTPLVGAQGQSPIWNQYSARRSADLGVFAEAWRSAW